MDGYVSIMNVNLSCGKDFYGINKDWPAFRRNNSRLEAGKDSYIIILKFRVEIYKTMPIISPNALLLCCYTVTTEGI
jgi:hypothetical protein